MDVFALRNRIIDDYRHYSQSFRRIRDEEIQQVVRKGLRDGHLWPEPLLQLNPAFEDGPPMDEMVASGLLHPKIPRYFQRRDPVADEPRPLRLRRHQSDAIAVANERRNFVLTTGTGSGKSLAYIVPIVDDILRRPELGGLRAIVVYPMNALANSQRLELEKYLADGHEVTFGVYTGQTGQDDREAMRKQPPHILLTNYVMLELILTRSEDRPLLDRTQHLRFLVLDELHTYRGRQGADVAMLLRRARAVCHGRDIVHIGTSATLAQARTWSEQQREVASFAGDLFGVPFAERDIIGESLKRQTRELDLGSSTLGAVLAARLAEARPRIDGDDPLAGWLESTVGLRRAEDGRLERARPLALGGEKGLAHRLSELTGVASEICQRALREVLLHDPPLFAFRLHQFLSRGGAVYATAEPPARRELTLVPQRFAPGEPRRPLLPLAFCRECGQDFLVVRHTVADDDDATVIYQERELNETVLEDDQEAGFLCFPETPWPDEHEALVDRLPESWSEEFRGKRRVVKARRDRLPQIVHVGSDAREHRAPQAETAEALFLRAPFLFCPACGVTYAATLRSDYGKLANLGSEGRSTATTVLSLSTLRELRTSDLPAEARKLLSFTDNRQDAALQAGHFNDFVEIGLSRSALYRATCEAGAHGLRHDELTSHLFAALALPRELYALSPDASYGQREQTDRALRDVLGYAIYRDLQQGWRVNQPNLEQCGLLRIDYLGLEQLCADDAAWDGADPILAAAPVGERRAVAKTFLDHLRRELVIAVPFLDRVYQEGMLQRSTLLTERWRLEDVSLLAKSRWAHLGARQRGRGRRDDLLFVSGRGSFGQFLARTLTGLAGQKSTRRDLVLRSLCEILTREAFLISDENRRSGQATYRLAAAKMCWLAGDGSEAFHDPLRIPDKPPGGLKTNAFFVDFYRQAGHRLLALEAREHTAQVRDADRQERELAFGKAELPLLFCSPTMELGVDIRDLCVVHLRNVPPTPANYAQRSGRAGRGGEPALVMTYCSTGSPHDQYFYRRPRRMVAGQVQRPRLDLENEDLLRAHVHAIWLAKSGLRFGTSMTSILVIEFGAGSLPLQGDVAQRLTDAHLRRQVKDTALDALRTVLEAADLRPSPEAWLDRVLDELPASFNRACERWRELYLSTEEQYRQQERISRDRSRKPKDLQKARQLRDEAQHKLDLLSESAGDEGFYSDFYPYRYLASEGFLPGYSFPRLPVTAYLPGRRRRRGRDGDALNRPRFLAIAEFGPRAAVYHEGSRYSIERVNLLSDDRGALTESLALCERCGHVHDLQGDQAPDLCARCGERALRVRGNLFRMRNVDAARRDRIQCDEEERRRLGFEIQTGIRFPARQSRRSAITAHLFDAGGQPLARLVYGAATEIFRFNLGPRRRRQRDGFVLDLERGYWSRQDTLEQDEDIRGESLTGRAQRVVPYVRDHRNALLFEPLVDDPADLDPHLLPSLQAALKVAVQVVFELENSELAAEPLPHRQDRRSILFFESAEGGAGVLHRLLDDASALARVAREARRLCHFTEPAEELPEPCTAACYDCLMSYTNQHDHHLLDRHSIAEWLARLAAARVEKEQGTAPRPEHLEDLARRADSDLERRFLELLEKHRLHLPTASQTLIEDCSVRPDFLYGDQGAAIFIDGPPHDEPAQQEKDRRQRECLADLGWTVLSFHHQADWLEILRQYPDLFGRLEEATPVVEAGAPEAAVFDPDLYPAEWLPLLAALRARGAVVEPGGDVEAAGRVVGQTVARIAFEEKSIELVDARVDEARALIEVLGDGGRVVLPGVVVEDLY